MLTRRHLMAGGAACLVAGTTVARAQADWPNRPVKVIVTYPAGGGESGARWCARLASSSAVDQARAGAAPRVISSSVRPLVSTPTNHSAIEAIRNVSAKVCST